METINYFLEVADATKVCEYFNNNDDIYDEFYIQVVDFNTIEITFNIEDFSSFEKEESLETIENVIESAKLY